MFGDHHNKLNSIFDKQKTDINKAVDKQPETLDSLTTDSELKVSAVLTKPDRVGDKPRPIDNLNQISDASLNNKLVVKSNFESTNKVGVGYVMMKTVGYSSYNKL